MRSLTLVTILCLTSLRPSPVCSTQSASREPRAWMVAAAVTCFRAATMSRRSEARRKGRPAVKMVIATQAPVVSRARAPRVFA